MTGRADYLALGDHNAVCYQCGRKRKASTLVRHWQGYFVCKEHWEPRQTQDFVRNVPDVITPPWAQPMPANVFLPTCSPESSSAIPGLAGAGCVIPSFISPFLDTSQLTPECNAIYVFVNDTVTSDETWWACNALVVEADLQLDGIVRIR